MGPPIMTLIEEGKPEGILLRMKIGGDAFMCVMPDDGRAYEDMMLSELRPWPAMDAMQMLSRVSGYTIKYLRTKAGV